MSREVDEQVVRLLLESDQFQREAEKSIDTIESLNKSIKGLSLRGMVDESAFMLEDSVEKVRDFSGVVGNVTQKISKMQIMGIASIENLTNSAVNSLKSIIKGATIDPVTSGFNKFGEKTKSVGTLISQGYDLDKVNSTVDRLRWFTDETSYNLLSMVETMGKFTATGMSLEDATDSVQGIALWAAKAGQNSQKASQAMYQLAQAMGRGVIRNEDWKSIQNYSMDNVEFRTKAVEAALLRGELTKLSNGLYKTNNSKAEYEFSNLFSSEGLTRGLWLTKDVFVDTMRTYNNATDVIRQFQDAYGEVSGETITASQAIKMLEGRVDDFALSSMKAAQEARTFGDMIDATKDAVSSQWMMIYENIFGDYKQATEFWTNLSETLWDAFAGPLYDLNADVLGPWSKGIEDLFDGASGRDMFIESLWNMFDIIGLLLEPIKELWAALFPPATAEGLLNFTQKLLRITEAIKTALQPVAEVAEAASQAAQNMIDEALALVSPLKPIGDAVETVGELGEAVAEVTGSIGGLDDIAKRVIGGEFGNMEPRFNALTELGHNWKVVQNRVNEMLDCNYRYEVSEEELAEAMKMYSESADESTESTSELSSEQSAISKRAKNLQDAMLMAAKVIDIIKSSLVVVIKVAREALVKGVAFFVGGAIDSLGNIARFINPFLDRLRNSGTDFMNTAKTLYDYVAAYWKKVVNEFTDLKNKLAPLYQSMIQAIKKSGALKKAVENIKKLLGTLKNVAVGLGKSITSEFKSFAKKEYMRTFGTILSNAVEYGSKIGDKISGAISVVSDYAEKAARYVSEWWSSFDASGAVVDAFSGALDFLGSVVKAVHGALKDLAKGIASWFDKHIGIKTIIETIGNAVMSLVKAIKSAYTVASNFIKDVVGRLASDVRVTRLINDVITLKNNIIDLAKALGSIAFNTIGGTLSTLFSGLFLPVSASYDPSLEGMTPEEIMGGSIDSGEIVGEMSQQASSVSLFSEAIGKFAEGMHDAVGWLIDRTDDVREFFEIFSKDTTNRITAMFDAISKLSSDIGLHDFIEGIKATVSKAGAAFGGVSTIVTAVTDFWVKIKSPFTLITKTIDAFVTKMGEFASEIDWGEIVEKLFALGTLYTVNNGINTLKKLGEVLLFIPNWLDSLMKGINALQWSKSAELASKSILNMAVSIAVIVGALFAVTFLVASYEEEFYTAFGAMAIFVWLLASFYKAYAALNNASANKKAAETAAKQVEADAKATDNATKLIKSSVDKYIFTPIKDLIVGLKISLDKYVTRLTLSPILYAVTAMIIAIAGVVAAIWYVTKDMSDKELGRTSEIIATALIGMAVFLFVIFKILGAFLEKVSKDKVDISSIGVILAMGYLIGKVFSVVVTLYNLVDAWYAEFDKKPTEAMQKLGFLAIAILAAIVIYDIFVSINASFFSKVGDGDIAKAKGAVDKAKQMYGVVKTLLVVAIFIKIITSSIKDVVDLIIPVAKDGSLPSGKDLAKRIGAVVISFIAIAALLWVILDKVDKLGEIPEGQTGAKFGTLIGIAIMVGVTMLAISSILKTLNKIGNGPDGSKLSTKEYVARIISLAGMILAISVFFIAVGKVANMLSESKNIPTLILAFALMAATMVAVGYAINLAMSANITTDKLKEFALCVGALLGGFALLVVGIAVISKLMQGKGGDLNTALLNVIIVMGAFTLTIAMFSLTMNMINSISVDFSQTLKALGVMALVVVAMIGIAALISFIDTKFAKGTLTSKLATMAISFFLISAAILALAAAIYVIGYALPAFINGLAQVGTLVEQNKEQIMKGVMTLGIIVGVALIAALGVILIQAKGGIIAVLGKLFTFVKGFIGKNAGLLKGAGAKILAMVSGFVTKFAALVPWIKSHMIIFVISIIAVVIGVIEAVAPDVADGLFRALIAIINGLADAIDNRGTELIAAFGRLAWSIVTVLMESIQDAFNSFSLTQMIGDSIKFSNGKSLGDYANGIWDAVQGLFPTNEKYVQDEGARKIAKNNLRKYDKEQKEYVKYTVDTDVEVNTNVTVGAGNGVPDITDISKMGAEMAARKGVQEAQASLDDNPEPLVVTPKVEFDPEAEKESLIEKGKSKIGDAFKAFGQGMKEQMNATDVGAQIFGEDGGLAIDIPIDGGLSLDNLDLSALSLDDPNMALILEQVGVSGDGIGSGLIDGLVSNVSSDGSQASISQSVSTVTSAAIDESAAESKANARSIGKNLVDGAVEGVNLNAWRLYNAASKMSTNTLGAMERRLDISSPSGETEEIGKYTVLGFANKINDMAYMASDAALNVVSKFMSGISQSNDVDFAPRVTPVIDTAGYYNSMSGIDSMLYNRSMEIRATVDNASTANRSIVNELRATKADNIRMGTEINRMRNDISMMRADIASAARSVSTMSVNIDGKRLVGEITPRIDRELGRISGRRL